MWDSCGLNFWRPWVLTLWCFFQSKAIRNRSCPDGIDQGEIIHHVSHQVHFGHVGSHPGWMQPLKNYSDKPRAFNATSEIIGRFCRYFQHVGSHVEGFSTPIEYSRSQKEKHLRVEPSNMNNNMNKGGTATHFFWAKSSRKKSSCTGQCWTGLWKTDTYAPRVKSGVAYPIGDGHRPQ